MPDEQNVKELYVKELYVKELWANFMSSIKSRELPIGDIEIGHRSTTMSLLGMLSMKLGRSIEWDSTKEQIVNDDAANKLLKRDYCGEWKYPV